VSVVVVVVTSVTTAEPSSQLEEQPEVLLLADEGRRSGVADAGVCCWVAGFNMMRFSPFFNKVPPHSCIQKFKWSCSGCIGITCPSGGILDASTTSSVLPNVPLPPSILSVMTCRKSHLVSVSDNISIAIRLTCETLWPTADPSV